MMELEKKQKIEIIEDSLASIRRSLDDLKVIESSDRTIINILRLLSTVKTIIGNDNNLVKDALSSDYETQVMVIESEIETYLALNNYQTISYPIGKKDFAENEKYVCKQLVDTDQKELDHTVERTVTLGIALSDGEIVIPPEINLYRYKEGESKKVHFPKFLSLKLLLVSGLMASLLFFLLFALDRDGLFFAHPLTSLGIVIPLAILLLGLSLGSFISRKRDAKTIFSDFVGLSTMLLSLLMVINIAFEFRIYMLIGVLGFFLVSLIYFCVRLGFYYSKKTEKKDIPLFTYIDKNKLCISAYSLILVLINQLMTFSYKFDTNPINLVVTIVFSVIYSAVMVGLTLTTKNWKKRISLLTGYSLSLILTSINLSWCLMGINFACALLTLFLILGEKVWQKKN